MKYAHILGKLTNEPLFLLPEKACEIIALVKARAAAPDFASLPQRGNALASHAEPGVVAYDDGDDRDPVEPPPLYNVTAAGVAVIRVEGIIGKRLSLMETMCGACDLDTVSAALLAAVGDSNVRCVLLDFDSPGGVGVGLKELSAQIADARETLPVIAFTDYLCASAAYWLAAACDEIYCTPSAIVGSIGAYIAAEDNSKAWTMAGRERLIFNGDATYKAIGVEGKPWTDAEKALKQEQSVKATAAIRAAAQLNRELALENMQGQTFDGEEALAANLVDGLVNSREDLLARLAGAVG